MPNENLGKDFSSELSNRTVYTDLDKVADSDERILTLKLDFPDVDEFKSFAGQGKEWSGSDRETQWLSNQIYTYDKEALNKNVNLMTRTYKSTVYDDRSMVAAIVRYTVN
jgi:hypothetical protein